GTWSYSSQPVQVHSDVELVELLEKLRPRHGVEAYLRADLREHARDRGTDALVVHVAVVGAVEAEVGALGIAGLGEQLPRPRRIEGREARLELGKAPSRGRYHRAGRSRHAAHH